MDVSNSSGSGLPSTVVTCSEAIRRIKLGIQFRQLEMFNKDAAGIVRRP